MYCAYEHLHTGSKDPEYLKLVEKFGENEGMLEAFDFLSEYSLEDFRKDLLNCKKDEDVYQCFNKFTGIRVMFPWLYSCYTFLRNKRQGNNLVIFTNYGFSYDPDKKRSYEEEKKCKLCSIDESSVDDKNKYRGDFKYDSEKKAYIISLSSNFIDHTFEREFLESDIETFELEFKEAYTNALNVIKTFESNKFLEKMEKHKHFFKRWYDNIDFMRHH